MYLYHLKRKRNTKMSTQADELIFKSITYGKCNMQEVVEKIQLFYDNTKKYDSIVTVVIGTDSQNFSDTKMVNVIAVTCEGHGGIFFYRITRLPIIRDVRTKLHTETNESLEIAMQLTEYMETHYKELFDNILFSIHIDAGTNKKGKTYELIPELVGWIKACGYECEIKPNSYVASSIADKLSK